jgi:hypothetical protein
MINIKIVLRVQREIKILSPAEPANFRRFILSKLESNFVIDVMTNRTFFVFVAARSQRRVAENFKWKTVVDFHILVFFRKVNRHLG